MDSGILELRNYSVFIISSSHRCSRSINIIVNIIMSSSGSGSSSNNCNNNK